MRAFFSIDAAFALLIAAVSFSSFALLSQAAAENSASQSRWASGELLALRFSSFILEKAARQGESPTGGYRIENDLDLPKLSEIDLKGMLTQSGRNFAGIYLESEGGRLFGAEAGIFDGEVFCARRLATLSGKTVRLEACIS